MPHPKNVRVIIESLYNNQKRCNKTKKQISIHTKQEIDFSAQDFDNNKTKMSLLAYSTLNPYELKLSRSLNSI